MCDDARTACGCASPCSVGDIRRGTLGLSHLGGVNAEVAAVGRGPAMVPHQLEQIARRKRAAHDEVLLRLE